MPFAKERLLPSLPREADVPEKTVLKERRLGGLLLQCRFDGAAIVRAFNNGARLLTVRFQDTTQAHHPLSQQGLPAQSRPPRFRLVFTASRTIRCQSRLRLSGQTVICVGVAGSAFFGGDRDGSLELFQAVLLPKRNCRLSGTFFRGQGSASFSEASVGDSAAGSSMASLDDDTDFCGWWGGRGYQAALFLLLTRQPGGGRAADSGTVAVVVVVLDDSDGVGDAGTSVTAAVFFLTSSWGGRVKASHWLPVAATCPAPCRPKFPHLPWPDESARFPGQYVAPTANQTHWSAPQTVPPVGLTA